MVFFGKILATDLQQNCLCCKFINKYILSLSVVFFFYDCINSDYVIYGSYFWEFFSSFCVFLTLSSTLNITFTINSLPWLLLTFPWFPYFLSDFIVVKCHGFGMPPSSTIQLNRTGSLFTISFLPFFNPFCLKTFILLIVFLMLLLIFF